MNITTQDQRDIAIALRDLADHNRGAADRMHTRWGDRNLKPEFASTMDAEARRLRQRAQHLTHLSRRIRSAKHIDITPEEGE